MNDNEPAKWRGMGFTRAYSERNQVWFPIAGDDEKPHGPRYRVRKIYVGRSPNHGECWKADFQYLGPIEKIGKFATIDEAKAACLAHFKDWE